MTGIRFGILIAVGTVAGFLLTGCGGSAPTTSMNSGPTTSSLVPTEVPTVPSPDLDTNRFASNPCDLLTAEQVAQIGAGVRGEVLENPLGPTCRWVAGETPVKNNFAVTVNNQTGGLAQLYARKATYRVWEPMRVAGRPAVVAIDADARNMGLCRLSIATSQQTLVAIDVRLSSSATDYTNPCPRAVTIGEAVLATVKG